LIFLKIHLTTYLADIHRFRAETGALRRLAKAVERVETCFGCRAVDADARRGEAQDHLNRGMAYAARRQFDQAIGE